MTNDDDLVLVRFFIEPCDGGYTAGVEVDGQPHYLPAAFRTKRAARKAAKALAGSLYESAREKGVVPRRVIKQ